MIDGEKLNKYVIPTMNVDRIARCGGVDPNEHHKAQIFITTAGYKMSFAYEKMIQLLVWMVVKGNAFVWGGDFRIPVLHGLLNEDFVEELKEDGTYNDSDFGREYESLWSGTSADVFFNPELFDRYRVLEEPHYHEKINPHIESFYILGVDVARLRAQTVVQVVKATRSPSGYHKSLVNTFVFENRHFLEQSIEIKKKVADFNARQVILDGTGLGVGIIDFLVIENEDPKTGIIYPPLSVSNDDNYDAFNKDSSIPLLHVIKPSDEVNSQIYINCLTQFSNGKVKLLIDERMAKAKLLETKEGRGFGSEHRAMHLMPFTYTSILKQEMMNLRQKQEGRFIRLEEVHKKGKDKFSAFVYALWYIKLLEDKLLQARKKRKFSDFVMYN